MDFTASQFSGGGDSGWTTYLEQSYVSGTQNDVGYGCYGFGETRPEEAQEEEEEEEEEDLSMVSDASSGPRCNYYEYNEDYSCYDENGFWFSGSSSSNESSKKKKETTNKDTKKKERLVAEYGQQFSGLDDTASSTLQALSSEKEFSISGRQGSSDTKTKGKSALRKHLRFLQSSVSGKPSSEGKGHGLQRRNRG